MAKVETSKLFMNIPTDLLSRLDAYASRMNINRTSAVCVLLSQSLDSQQMMRDFNKAIEIASASKPVEL